MKRNIIFGLLLLMVATASAQVVERHDNRYVADGHTYCTSTAFRGYLKNTSPELFAQYNKGYTTAMVGWGLFAFGAATGATSGLWLITQLGGTAIPVQAAIGGAAMIAGIGMLGVGYHKMHRVVDVYGVPQAETPQAYWNINLTGNGIGLVCNF